jgi:hypothetical protein
MMGFIGLRVVLQGFSMRQPNMNAISASGGARSVLSVSEHAPLHVTAVTEDLRHQLWHRHLVRSGAVTSLGWW